MTLRVISMGWGVQSLGMTIMSAMGLLPPVDAVVWGDTTFERRATYETARYWTPWLEAHGIQVVTVHAPKHRRNVIDPFGAIQIPAYTRWAKDTPYIKVEYPPTRKPTGVEMKAREQWKEVKAFFGPIEKQTVSVPPPDMFTLAAQPISINDVIDMEPNDYRPRGLTRQIFGIHHAGDPSGMLQRQCTYDWKIAPVRRWISKELKRRGLKKAPDIAEVWLGITLDEIDRMKPSDVQYIKNSFPFLEMLEPAWTREKLIDWFHENNFEVPAKSSCVMCPYHEKALWQEIRDDLVDWKRVQEIDQIIRHKRPGFLCYLTSERKPVNECDFKKDMTLLGLEQAECTGTCFL